jgi:hypothetical protein
LSQGNDALGSVLLEIDQGTLEQLQRVVESGSAGFLEPDASTESASDILHRRVGRLSQWAQRSKRPAQSDMPHVIQWFVVPDQSKGDDSEKPS